MKNYNPFPPNGCFYGVYDMTGGGRRGEELLTLGGKSPTLL